MYHRLLVSRERTHLSGDWFKKRNIYIYKYISFVHEELFPVETGCISVFLCPIWSDREI